MTPPDKPSQSANTPHKPLPTWAVPVVFIGLTLFLLLDPWSYVSPASPHVDVPAEMLDTTPVRTPDLKPEIEIGAFTYRCNECHNLFPSPKETRRTLTQHQHIQLKHGINTRCFNCHNIADRNTLVDDFGDPIPFDKPQLLCAKCHGPVYRDWLNGAHGRTNGYWDTSKGEMSRRKCIECHDPHNPAFGSMTPAPAPNTLRLPDTPDDEESSAHGDESTTTRNPLIIYNQKGSHE